MTSIILALVIGGVFGAVLDRIGATDPNWIGRMLSLKNLHLMKTILLAIGTAAVLMFAGQMLGLVDVAHMSVKSAYMGVFIGGLMLGAGWAAGGYCPGTGVAAAATGRKDALVFIAGGLLGAAAYMVTYPMWKAAGLLDGSALTLGKVPGASYDALIGVRGDLVGIIMGVAFIVIALILPSKPLGKQESGLATPAE